MTRENEESIFEQILILLEAQRQLLQEKLSRDDHTRFTEQAQQIQDLIARLNREELAGSV